MAHLCPLNGPWILRVTGDLEPVPTALRAGLRRGIAGRLPGCVHTDLIAAGLVDEPDRGFAERACQWVSEVDWTYEREVELDAELLAHDRVELVLDGLDTVAAVSLGERELGRAMSMHCPHRFAVPGGGTSGPVPLRLAFVSPRRHVRAEVARLGARPVNGDWGAYAYIRKAACHFGWDWGPMLPTVGVWGSIGLHAWRIARLRGVRPLVASAEPSRAVVEVAVDLERNDAATPLVVHVRLVTPDGCAMESSHAVPPGAERLRAVVEIDRPARWWPRGLGEPALHDLCVELAHGDAPLDTWRGRVGLREIELDRSGDGDGDGSAFALRVNGCPIFAKGANWIPNGLLAPADDAVVVDRIEQAIAANMNMLRVWGGGRYESSAFYAACDARGVLVWQDAMLACATYPEEPPYPELFEAELRYQVTRLASHPSIVLWCGGNENILAYESWGWKASMPAQQTWGRRYFHELFPSIMAELDPTRPYWPDSPWSGDPTRHPQDGDHGDRHTWDDRVEAYRARVPRFVSEFGHQAPPQLASLRGVLPPEQLERGTDAMTHRQRAWGGNERQYDEPLGERFAAPATFVAWHYLAQLLQARALAIGIEWWRAHRPRCMGALVWQLNDCWTGHSWSLVDGQGRRKPAWYAVRRAFAPRRLTIHSYAGRPTLFAINDERVVWDRAVKLRRMRFDGTELAGREHAMTVPPACGAAVADLEAALGAPGDPRRELLVAEAGNDRAFWFFDVDRNLHYPPPRFALAIDGDDDAIVLTLETETLLRDVVVAPDLIDPRAAPDDNLLTLLPGDRRTLHLGKGDIPLFREALLGAPTGGPSGVSREKSGMSPLLGWANGFGATATP